MISTKKESYKEFTIYLLLFLIGFNFAGNAIFLIYMLAIFVLVFINNSLVLPKSFFTIIILCVGVLLSQLINNIEVSLFSLLKLGVYPLVFLVFYNISNYEMKINEDKNDCLVIFFYMMLFFSLGNMAHMIADMLITDLSKINIGRRILNDIWSKGTAPTTIIVGWGCINMATVLYSFERKREKMLTFLISSVMMIVYLAFSFIVATRMGIVNSLVIVSLFVIMLIRDREIKITYDTILKLFFYIVVAIIVGIKLSPFIMSSNLYYRLTEDSLGLLDSNGRSNATIYLLQHFYEALLGGEYFTRQYGLQQHNILSQMYDLYGLVPFFCLGLIVVNSIKLTLRVVNNRCFRNPEKRFVVLVYLSIMLYCFEEPAITSNHIITSMLFGYLGYMIPARGMIDKEEVKNG